MHDMFDFKKKEREWMTEGGEREKRGKIGHGLSGAP